MRAFKRRIDQTISQTFVYLCSRKVDQFYVLSIINYVLSILWTFGIYQAYPYDIVLLTGFMLPAIGFCFFNIIQIYIRNNYFFIEDVPGMNRNIDAHNKRVDALKLQARELRDKIVNGGIEAVEAIYGEENARLVKKVMDLEVMKRKAQKLEAIVNQDQDEDDGQDFSSMRSLTGKYSRRKPRNSPLSSPNKAQNNVKLVDDNTKIIPQASIENIHDITLAPEDKLTEKAPMFGATMQGFKLDEDSDEEDIDAIPAELRGYYPSRIDKKRKKISTWEDKGIGCMKAFFTGEMRSNDTQLYWSFIMLVSLLIIYGSLATGYSYKGFGIMIAFTALHVIMLVISMLGYIIANR